MPNAKPISTRAKVTHIKTRKPKKAVVKGIKPIKTKPKY